MQAKRFWPPTKHKLLYANLIVYGIIIVLALVFHHELIWAQKTLHGYLFSGKFPPPAPISLIEEVTERTKADGDAKTMKPLLEQALQIDPYSQASLLLGVYYFSGGNFGKAMAYYDRYRSIEPSFAAVYLQMSEILEKKQERKAIKQLLTEGVKHFRRRVELYQPHYDPNVPKEFNLKALRIYNQSQEGLELLEKMQEQLSNSK